MNSASADHRLLIGNTCKREEGKKSKVTLFVRPHPGHEEDLNAVLRVIFELHTTFAKPERVITARPFETTVNLWGTFAVPVTIEFKDGSEPAIFEHEISFEAPVTQRAVPFTKSSKSIRDPSIALVNAVKLGDKERVSKHLPRCANDPEAIHRATLHAIVEHRPECLALLLGEAVNAKRDIWSVLNHPDYNKKQTVGKKASRGEVSFVESLLAEKVQDALSQGASHRVQDSTGRRPQHHAARNGQIAVLEVLRRAGGVDSGVCSSGQNVLHHAALGASVGSTRALLAMEEVTDEMLDARCTGGKWGPGLTPALMCAAVADSYFPSRAAESRALFDALRVPFAAVQDVLEGTHIVGTRGQPGGATAPWGGRAASNPKPNPRALEALVAALSALETRVEGNGGPQRRRRLRWYEYLVAADGINEGRGIVEWNTERAALLAERLVSPLLGAIGREELPDSARDFAKRLLADVSATGTIEGTPGGLVREHALTASGVIRSSLEAAQAALCRLPDATSAVREQCQLPEGWGGVPRTRGDDARAQ